MCNERTRFSRFSVRIIVTHCTRYLTVDLRFKFDHYPKHVKEKDKTRWKQMQQKLDQRQRQKEILSIAIENGSPPTTNVTNPILPEEGRKSLWNLSGHNHLITGVTAMFRWNWNRIGRQKPAYRAPSFVCIGPRARSAKTRKTIAGARVISVDNWHGE